MANYTVFSTASLIYYETHVSANMTQVLANILVQCNKICFLCKDGL